MSNQWAFERCTPEEVGIASEGILRLLDQLENCGSTWMHGLMILRHDKVCAEGWWAPFAPGLHHALHSLSKTWTATAVGLAEYEGLLKMDDPVCKLLPDKMPTPLPEKVAHITVRDILTMSSGSETQGSTYGEDWIREFFARPFEHEPGTFWCYNSQGTAIASALVERATGMSMLDYLDTRLFRKIGVDASHVMCYRGADGTCLGGHGMFTTTEDNLRLMRLYLHGGVWNGERLLHERFVKEATSPLMDTAPAHAHTPWIYDNRVGYGYQIWMCRPEGSYRADGAYGQFCVVVPKLDLIVSINEGAYIGQHMSHNELEQLKGRPMGEDHPVHGPQNTLNILFDTLLPAITEGDASLPESHASHLLKERLSRLSMPRPALSVTNHEQRPFHVTLVPEEGRITFAMLHGMDKHNAPWPGVERMHLSTAEGLMTLAFTEGGKDRSILFDMRGGRWLGKLRYTENRELVSDVACAAWWSGENTLELSILWYETEGENRFTFSFEGEFVRIHKWVQAGMEDEMQHRDALYRVAEGNA